ncbi:hypothetical protein [Stygiolobus caldivivus]|uniref:Uncharacterized protein n=1 Tax=Stygiolobus caldivivus TaxID=2824673 RepID=A0A8D5U9H7_9CREN|nr:hypothetical protein [Stygiolobus caldivivus]BCU71525.1 hypothetical protein KN1_28220 [Stygiolobus caldivivus]
MILIEEVYERLEDELVIKKLEENIYAIRSLRAEVKRLGEAVVSLQET